MNAVDFLDAVAGVARPDLPPRHRLGTIDPAYTVGSVTNPTLPKVTFDGETTMSTKTYPIVAGYVPAAGDRVVLAPVGRTYVILGTLTHPYALQQGARGLVAGPQTLTTQSSAYAAVDSDTDMTLTLTTSAARNYRIHLHTSWFVNGPAVWHVFATINGTDTFRLAQFISDGTILDGTVHGSALWQPTAGSKTVLITVNNFSGISTLRLYAAGDSPRQLWIEDVGPR